MTISALSIVVCAATVACDYPPLPAPPACVAPYTSTSDGCYRLEKQLTTWLAAEQDCEADAPDGHLVVINSVKEHFAIHDFSAGANDVWIGYTDRVTDGMMRWVAPGGLDPSTDACFFGSEANPAGATCATQMTQNACNPPSVGDWFYRGCNELHAYICERDGSPANPATY